MHKRRVYEAKQRSRLQLKKLISRVPVLRMEEEEEAEALISLFFCLPI
jgi:hypothetical protein